MSALKFSNTELKNLVEQASVPTSRALVPYTNKTPAVAYKPFSNSNPTSRINFKSSFKGGPSLLKSTPYITVASMGGQALLDLIKNKFISMQEELNSIQSTSTNEPETTVSNSFSNSNIVPENSSSAPVVPKLETPSYQGTTLTKILNDSGSSVGEVAKQLEYSNMLNYFQHEVNSVFADKQLEQLKLTNDLQQIAVNTSLANAEIDVAYKELNNSLQSQILSTLKSLVDASNANSSLLVNGLKDNFKAVSDTLDGVSKNINPPERAEFYTKQTEVATHQTTPQDIKDLDGNVIVNDTPLNIKTKADATLAKKTTDENNLELEDDDFHMWDNLPNMDFLIPENYSQVYEID